MITACQSDDKLFTSLSKSKTGIDFINILEESADLNVLNDTYFYNGGGVAVGDVNNDGLTDVLFTGNMVKNRLFINKGSMEFEDITQTSGVAEAQGWCTGATMVDINQDGWLNIYICRSADMQAERRKNLLFINNKGLTGSYSPVNADGEKDIIFGGNLSTARIKFGKYDASLGTVLLGDGKGNFQNVPASKTGLNLKGDVRSMVMVGKKLVVGVNNEKVRVFGF